MLVPRIVGAVFSAGLMVLGVGGASGQDFPNKPIRILTQVPGGGSDFAARIIAQGISGPLGQPVIVENRGGASGIIAAQTVAKATPDGYTLLLYANGFWLAPFLQDNVPYDPVRDFSPITLALRTPLILAVNPSVPVKSVKELIGLAKAKPGELNYASGGPGTVPHLAAELFKYMAGANIVYVPYKGAGPAVTALVGNEVQMMFANAGLVAPHVKPGRLRSLAITSAKPSSAFPGLPTVAASGLPDYESEQIYGIFAPAKTPGPSINRLNRELVRFLKTADAKETFSSSGAETVGSLPEEFASFVKADMARMGKVIKTAGIKID